MTKLTNSAMLLGKHQLLSVGRHSCHSPTSGCRLTTHGCQLNTKGRQLCAIHHQPTAILHSGKLRLRLSARYKSKMKKKKTTFQSLRTALVQANGNRANPAAETQNSGLAQEFGTLPYIAESAKLWGGGGGLQ